MKTIIKLLLFIFISSNSFALDATTNSYFESANFRIIIGSSYIDDPKIIAYKDKILENLPIIKTKYEELGFTFDESSFTDIYISNTQAYNYIDGYEINNPDMSICTENSCFYGYSWYYLEPQNKKFFVVLNPNMTNDELLITLAHELFHTIQLSLFDDSKIEINQWGRDIWWIEATATLLEDEAFNDINQYIIYLDDYIDYSYENIEVYSSFWEFRNMNNNHEYSRVLFAKYIKERFGIELIKKSFEQIDNSVDKSFYTLIDEILKNDYQSSMKDALKEFGIWLTNPSYYFEEGDLYSNININRYSLLEVKPIQKGGIILLKDLENYPIESKENYSQTNEYGVENILSSLTDTIVISNFSTQDISPIMLNINYNQEVIYALNNGWQLLSGKDINTTKLENSSCLEIVWGYKNSEWEYYSPSIKLTNYNDISTLSSTDGYWFKSFGNCLLMN